MTDPDTISADYTLRPSELAATLALLVEARQPTLVWGPPGAAKSAIAQQVATDAGRQYVDVRTLLLDPVDLRGIPWRDSADRTRWAPPAFLPPTDDPGRWLINLEELPSAVPMVQAALYQLVLDRKVGEYESARGRLADRLRQPRKPTAGWCIACRRRWRRASSIWRSGSMPRTGCAWGAANGISRPRSLFYIQMRPEHAAPVRSRSRARRLFRCPRTWEMASNIVQHRRAGLDATRPNGRSSGAPWARPPRSSFPRS